MSKSFVFTRYDVISPDPWVTKWECMDETSDGEYVLAQDALDREAVLQAQIRTLETQLKDARALSTEMSKAAWKVGFETGKANQPEPAYTYREAGVWEPDGRKFSTYREESLDGKAMYIKE